MKLVTASQMQSIDKVAIEKYRIHSLDLMERAGKGVSDFIQRHFNKTDIVSILVGKGNNGGDGLVVARHLKKTGFKVELYITSPVSEFSNDANANWEKLADLKIPIIELFSDTDIKKQIGRIEKSGCIVDAIFGTGLSSEVSGRHKLLIEKVNALIKPVVAVDIPSGLSADSGVALGAAIRAKYTVTFGVIKVGLVTNLGSEYAGEIEVVDIGIPKDMTEKMETGFNLINTDLFKAHFGPRPKDSHKGDYGRVLVVGGSVGKIGAGLLASRAALRSGAGLVTYALPEAAYTKFDVKSPEIMYEGISDGGKGFFTKDSLKQLLTLVQDKSVIALGPGMGTLGEVKDVVLEIIKKTLAPIVLDADGLNCIADNIGHFKGRKVPLVLTPHPGEMARLANTTTVKIQADRVGVAKAFAKSSGHYLVLKGHRTIVATPQGSVYINATGNPGMASAGQGDVLTGIISGFIAQEIPMLESILAGVYIHGMAGDIALSEMGEKGLIASDVINNLPKAIKTVSRES